MRIGLVRGLVALLLLPGISHALGLGDVHLNSPLNAPLDAEIELVNATPEDLATLDAKLATKETFARYGLDWPPFMASVTVTRDRAANGAQVLRIKSTETVTEPFLTLLIEATWARGRLVREYTVLLDPPVFAPNSVAAAPVPAPAVPQSQAAGQISRPAPEQAAPSAMPQAPGRWWRQLRSAAWRQPLGHRAPPVRQQRAAHRPAHGVYLPWQFRRVRRRHEPAARRLRIAHPGRRRSRGGIAVGSARRNPSQRRLVCGLAGLQRSRPSAPGSAQRVGRQRRLRYRQFRRSLAAAGPRTRPRRPAQRIQAHARAAQYRARRSAGQAGSFPAGARRTTGADTRAGRDACSDA